jgi:hypothetical protein
LIAGEKLPEVSYRWTEVRVMPPCDTHCLGLEIAEIAEAGKNVRVTARAVDDGGNSILYTFTARRGTFTDTIGPQTESIADFDLPPGRYTITVSVSDDSECLLAAPDAVCRRSGFVVPEPPPLSLQLPGDCNQDGKTDISDALCLLGFLFHGAPTRLPCDDSPVAGGSVSLVDWQSDGKLDVADGIGLVQFLFSGGAPHALGTECTTIAGCPASCASDR